MIKTVTTQVNIDDLRDQRDHLLMLIKLDKDNGETDEHLDGLINMLDSILDKHS